MNKLFRPKCMRRMAVFMALVAPIIYLFGSLFFALNGAHGTQVFADEVIGEGSRFVEVDNTDYFGSYRFTWDEDAPAPVSAQTIFLNFTSDGSSFTGLTMYPSKEIYYLSAGGGSNPIIRSSSGVFVSRYLTLTFNISSANHNAERLLPYGALYFDEAFSPETQFSDYVFGQFFEKDNFLVQWGENAISEDPYGFAPFGYFWRYLDINFLHLSNDPAGLMAYGYMYYAAHVLLFDVGFIMVTFFLTFIQKVADKIGGEDHV